MAKEPIWDRHCRDCTEQFVHNPYFNYKGKELERLIQKWAPEKLGGDVLKTDLFEEAMGTNDSIIFTLMLKSKGTLWGMDISKAIVEKARENADKLNVAFKASVQDARKTDFEADKFDLIISNSTLDHFPELDEALADHYRILKKGATLILTIHNKNNPLVFIVFFLLSMIREKKYFTDIAYSRKHLLKKLKETGFTVVAGDGANCSPPILPTLTNMAYKRKNPFLMWFFKKWYHYADLLSRRETKLNFLTGYLLAFKLTKE